MIDVRLVFFLIFSLCNPVIAQDLFRVNDSHRENDQHTKILLINDSKMALPKETGLRQHRSITVRYRSDVNEKALIWLKTLVQKNQLFHYGEQIYLVKCGTEETDNWRWSDADCDYAIYFEGLQMCIVEPGAFTMRSWLVVQDDGFLVKKTRPVNNEEC